MEDGDLGEMQALYVPTKRGNPLLMHHYSFGPSLFFYQAFACYDLLDNGRQKLDEYGIWTANT